MNKRLAVASVPIGTNLKTRKSRLFKSIPDFLGRSVTTMIRMYTMYQPMKVFFYIGFLLILSGMIPSVRFLIYYFMGQGAGHVQSLILAAVFSL